MKSIIEKAKALSKSKKITISLLVLGLIVFSSAVVGFLIITDRISLRETAPGITDVEVTEAPVSADIHTAMKDLKAVWFSPLDDLSPAQKLTVEEIKEHLDAVKSLGFNAIITPLTVDGEKKQIKINKFDVDIAGIVADEAKSRGLFVVGCIDAAYYFGKNNSFVFDFDAVKDVLSVISSVDALLLKGADKLNVAVGTDEDNTKALTAALKDFSEKFKSNFGGKALGLSVSPVWANSSSNELGSKTAYSYESLKGFADTRDWAITGLADFILVDAATSTTDTDSPFSEIAGWWNSLDSKSFIYFSHHLDFLHDGKGGFDSSKEIIEQLKAIDCLDRISGSAFYSYKELKSDILGSASAIAAFYSGTSNSEIAAKELKLTSPATQKVKTEKQAFSFIGVSDPTSLVFMNDKPIERTADGLFSLEVNLKPGDNSFVFKHKGKEFKYTITYTIDLLQEVSPSDKTTAPVGTKIEIAAYSKKDATVYAKIGNAKVSLKATDSDLFGKGEGIVDFATFIGEYTLPEISTTRQSLGKITVYAQQNGFTDTIQGGEIIVTNENNGFSKYNLSEAEIKAADSAYPYKSLLNPYTDHALGQDKICIVTRDYAEATALSEPSDKSDPRLTPLLKGSIDYVTGIATYNGQEHYLLRSGRKIYSKDAKLAANAYKMPLNNLQIIKTENGKTTDIYIKTDWLVPINAELKPQNYHVGFEGRPFNVSSFTSSYIDFLFYYTDRVSGKPEFSENSVLKDAQWLAGKENSLKVLRLNLREAGKFYGYSMTVTSDGYIKISFKQKITSLSGMTIMLDPGHGGKKDPGTYSVYPNLNEKEINIKLATIMKRELEAKGATVIFTRTQDVDMPREERALFAKKKNPDLYVSVHCDGSESSSLSGTHSFYYRAFSKPLADSIHKELVSAYRNVIYTPDSTAYNKVDRGVKFKPFNVTRIEECPSVLIEFGFLTNASDCNVLINPQYQEVLAKAAAKGIENYVLSQK